MMGRREVTSLLGRGGGMALGGAANSSQGSCR
jgi:hypothetical protein